MTGLPEALKSWGEPLSAFPPDLALSLGPWLRRLSLGMGPLRARAAPGLHEPDGYDGVTRRGPYERLLVSEWLLATEVPEEFIRRAAMREHAFLRLAHQAPAGSRRSVALFDPGPSQLGAPRIAHLAALLVLARRAQDGGAAFAWGFLQHPDVPLIEEVTPASVLRLLHGRTALVSGSAHAVRWAEALRPAQPDDVWLVGPPLLARVAADLKASALCVEDVLEPGARQVAVAIRRHRSEALALRLELPAPADCTRLLRDPFSAAAAPNVVSSDPARPVQLLHSANGRRLLLWLADGSVAAHPIPNSPRAPVGKARRFQPSSRQRVVAMGWSSRLLVVTWSEEHGLWIHGARTHVFRVQGLHETFTPPRPGDPISPCHAVVRGGKSQVVFTDGAGRLYAVAADNGDKFEVMAVGARAFASTHLDFSYVHWVRDEAWPGGGGEHLVQEVGGSGHGDSMPLTGASPLELHLSPRVLAVRQTDSRWKVLSGSTATEQEVPGGIRVVGVASALRWGHDALLCLGEDRRSLALLSVTGGGRKLCVAEQEIVQVSVNPDWKMLGYLTVRGEVLVYSVSHGATVLRLTPGAAPGYRVDGGRP